MAASAAGCPARRRGHRLAGLKVASVAVLVPLLMRQPLSTVARLLRYAAPPRHPGRARPRLGGDPELLAAALRRAQHRGRPLVRGGCQTRAVTLYWFLRRAGYAVELCFGIEPSPAEPRGHCWLELAGEPFLEPGDPRTRFAEMLRIP